MRKPRVTIAGKWSDGTPFAFTIPLPFAERTAEIVAQHSSTYDVTVQRGTRIRKARYDGGFAGWGEWEEGQA